MEIKHNEITCPACGSHELDMSVTRKTIAEPYSEPIEVSMEVFKCKICGMEGDFSGHGDELITVAIENAKRNAIVHIIDEFIHNDISMASIERALDLPQRTLTKWKNGLSIPSATGTALMNVIKTYPWILTVAQYKYDPLIARNVHISNAMHELLKLAPLGYGSMPSETAVVVTGDSIFMFHKYDKNEGLDSSSVVINVMAEDSNQKSYLIQNKNAYIVEA
jgi:hypothetical protein